MVNYLEEIKQFGQFNSGNMLQLHVPSVFSHLKFSQEVINIIFASYLHFYAFFVQWGKNELKEIYFHFILHFYFLLTCGLLSVFHWNTEIQNMMTMIFIRVAAWQPDTFIWYETAFSLVNHQNMSEYVKLEISETSHLDLNIKK